MLDIREAAPENLGAIESLLAMCHLPTGDVRTGTIAFFVAESERGIIGVVGLENFHDGNALLRSLAVMPGLRKQQIGRQLLQRLYLHAEAQGVAKLYLLTELATDYFRQMGFAVVDRAQAPESVRRSRQFAEFCPASAILMSRAARARAAPTGGAAEEVARSAREHFDNGFHCAESVILAIAQRLGIDSPLLPAIATGFGKGIAAAGGSCGALNGGLMAVNLVYGRKTPEQPLAENMQMVRRLICDFDRSCGSQACAERITDEAAHGNPQARCRESVGNAARLAAALIEEKVSLGCGRRLP